MFSSEMILIENKEICLEINGKQSEELKSGSIKFKNYFNQIAVSFKIYVDTECNLEKIHINDREKNTSYTEKYKNHIPCSFANKVVCIDDNLANQLLFTEKKM